jgi:hypothetical protein
MPEHEEGTNPKPGTTSAGKTKKPIKGGSKGGTRFPRVALKQALEYSKKLVSKTAVGPQPEHTILAGVFNNAGPEGKVRASALKQFGLLEGTTAGYKATQLAKDIEAAADESEKKPLLVRAFLTAKVFKEIFNTYQGDQAAKGKIRGRALQLDVHPDAGEACADLFITSALTAGLGTADGDGVRLVDATSLGQLPTAEDSEAEKPTTDNGANSDAEEARSRREEQEKQDLAAGNQADKDQLTLPRRRGADITLNLTVDSSLDGEKLEKQLATLRKYGLI